MLKDLGFEVVEANSADGALQMMRNGLQPDLLITDHIMPGMSGAQLVREVQAEWPTTSSLIVSGYAEADSIDADIARLIKPFCNAELAAALARPAVAANHYD